MFGAIINKKINNLEMLCIYDSNGVCYSNPIKDFQMIVNTINTLFQIYTLMIFGRIISSWIPEFQDTKIMRFIAFYTDPYLNIFRRIIPPLGFIDISPIFAFMALEFLRMFIVSWLK